MKNELIEQKTKQILSLLEKSGDPLTADISALDATIRNLKNYFAADDLAQACEYATLASKQASDVYSNIEVMKKAKEAAAGVNKPVAEVPPVEEGKLPKDYNMESEEGKKALLEAEEKQINELAEKSLLTSILKEKKDLTEAEKKFIESVEKIEMTDEVRVKVLEAAKKMKAAKIKKEVKK